MPFASELLILQRLRALTRTLPAARQGHVKAIHQARVATRRLREALPLVVDGSRGRKLGQRVRRLTRALGPVRELDVVLETLDALDAAGEVPARATECLRTVVTEERQRLYENMARCLDDFDLDKLRKRAVAGARKHDVRLAGVQARRGRSPRGTSAISRRRGAEADRAAGADRRAARRAEALRSAIENAAGIYLPDRLHEVRIAVKKLRYAMEVARDLRGSRAAVRIRTLKRSQESLGQIHDLEVLIARTRAVQGSALAADLRLSGDLDRLVRHLETEGRRLHGDYIVTRPALLAVCDHAVAVPQRHHAPAA
jgi:CHAD domain-containing protein